MPAGDRFFVDTNVLLYEIDASEPKKQRQAHSWINMLWEESAGALSWQVLHEFYVNATKKLGSSASHARSVVELFTQWQPVDTTYALIQRGWYWTDTAQISYWDALILAAAERRGCQWLLSEDFQAGQKLGSITVVNPFGKLPEEFGLKGGSTRR
jgi:predicted nucleic acid-binding protein